ncbi:MAG: 4,5:9,10-diseco-3-hydroxy-5,9, 17-trioxoandrosta(10),2-diene-4-oate hydrolase [Pseudomonadota bacterium]
MTTTPAPASSHPQNPRFYTPRRALTRTFVPVRHLRYHVLQWGQPQAHVPPLVMLHGWMDVGASFQFVVDALPTDRWVIAPDWRGFGLSDVGPSDVFWFPDYLADLDALLHQLCPDAVIDLVGHSMGGNVAMMYAGTRPERVRRLVNLEGFGLPASRPAQAPTRMAQWLDEVRALHQGGKDLKTYPSLSAVAQRLMKTNPRLPEDKAHWLAQHWAVQASGKESGDNSAEGSGQWRILGDAGHKVINPQLYRVEEALAFYQRLSMPVLAIEASDNQMARWWQGRYTLDEYHERLKSVPHVRIAEVSQAGHMLHHDQPEVVAKLLEDFLKP